MTETRQATDLTLAKPERRLHALAVSRGVGIGRITYFCGERRSFFRLNLNDEQIGNELIRLKSALETSIHQLRELSAGSRTAADQSVSDIFGVHLLMLESSFVKKIESVIASHRANSEWAIRAVLDEYVEKQRSVSDPQFREKHLDIEDVANRLLTALGSLHTEAHYDNSLVIVARELGPAMILEIAKTRPAAIITEHGGWTSHSSIVAREFNLPMVSGVRDIEHLASTNDLVLVDGMNGEVILNPAEETLAGFRAAGVVSDISPDVSESQKSPGVVTQDGMTVTIRANSDNAASYLRARDDGADGIGLFRSESLLSPGREIPSEDQQVDAYRRIAEVVGEAVVKIRTFDLNAGGLSGVEKNTERNPSLGMRSIRLSLTELTQFRIQLRSLLRASLNNNLDIIFPMISGVDEILRAKEILEEERIDLTNKMFGTGAPKIGAMIETPSAVLTATEIAGSVDFLCLGTNDLVQYLLAVDRDNEAVADWYQTLHPAVIRAVGEVLSAGSRAGIDVVVCGEMASSPFYVPVLLGLGARELSINVNSVRPVRRLIAGIAMNDAVALVERIRTLATAEEIESSLREYYLANWSGLFPPGLLNVRHR